MSTRRSSVGVHERVLDAGADLLDERVDVDGDRREVRSEIGVQRRRRRKASVADVPRLRRPGGTDKGGEEQHQHLNTRG